MSNYREYESIEEFNHERNQALMAMDINWLYGSLVACGIKDPDPEAVLIAAHRSRYHIKTLPASYRHESAKWLRDRGYKDFHGMDLLPDGQLPE